MKRRRYRGSEVTVVDAAAMARLLVPLQRLPGFDPAGLMVRAGDLDVHYVQPLDCGEHAVISSWDDGCDIHAGPILVNLADPSTADRVARWLADVVGLEVGCTAPTWHRVRVSDPLAPDVVFSWVLVGAPGEEWLVFPSQYQGVATIDPTDERYLPDGSRYGDRLGMVVVAEAIGAKVNA